MFWSDILLNVFLAIAVDNLAGGGGKKKVEWVSVFVLAVNWDPSEAAVMCF